MNTLITHFGTHVGIHLFANFPKLAGVLGLLISLLFGSLGIHWWTEYQTFPDSPENILLSKLPPKILGGKSYWVSISDAKVDCASLIYNTFTKNSEVNYVDDKRSMVIMATYANKPSCAEIEKPPLVGTIEQITEKRYTFLSSNNPTWQAYRREQIFNFCAYCGRPNSLIGVVVSIVLTTLGLSYHPVCVWSQKRTERQDTMNYLKSSLQVLSASADSQIKFLKYDETDEVEGCQLIDDFAEWVWEVHQSHEKHLKHKQLESLNELEAYATKLLAIDDPIFNSEVGLRSHGEWQHLRSLAQNTLHEFNWPLQARRNLGVALGDWFKKTSDSGKPSK